MDSPRSGLRRAAAASWALAGLGIAGVTGASTLAYADTFKPPAAESPVIPVVVPTPPESSVTTVTAEPSPPSVAPESVIAATPVVPEYTPVPDYTPQPTVEQAPPAETQQAPKPSVTTPPTTKRRTFAPTTVMAPNYSPHITVSRGS